MLFIAVLLLASTLTRAASCGTVRHGTTHRYARVLVYLGNLDKQAAVLEMQREEAQNVPLKTQHCAAALVNYNAALVVYGQILGKDHSDNGGECGAPGRNPLV